MSVLVRIRVLCLLFFLSLKDSESTETCESAVKLHMIDEFPISTAGIVRVCLNGEWGYVCGDGWDANDASVVCRHLGFGDKAQLISESAVQRDSEVIVEGNSTFFLKAIMCNGNEESLKDCSNAVPIYDEECYSPPVTVICPLPESHQVCNDNSLELRLPNGTLSDSMGLVHVCFGGRWYQICDHDWTDSDINVICGQLGYYGPGNMRAPNFSMTAEADNSTIIFLEGGTIMCSESTIQECQYVGSSSRYRCDSKVIGVICNASSELPAVSMTDGPNSTSEQTTQDNITSTEEHTVPATTEESLPSSGDITIGVTVGAIAAGVIALIVVIVLVMLISQYRRLSRKKQDLEMRKFSNPTPESSSADAILRIYSNKENKKDRQTADRPIIEGNLYETRGYPVHQSPRVLSHPTKLLLPQNSKVIGKISPSIIRELTSNMLIPFSKLNLLDSVGQGEFGVVYKAEYTEDEGEMVTSIVAVKTMKGFFDDQGNEQLNKIMTESLKMKHFDHPNVLNLIGVCIDGGSAPFIVMPFMANGSVLHYLKKERSNIVLPLDSEIDDDLKVDIRKRLTVMCLQIAKGMEYLAREKFVHRDLAARNCMIDIHFVIKIADFGLTEDVYSKNYFKQTTSDTHVKLPVKWMAPESLTDGLFSEKTDVWSFGITCWEIFSGGKTPYAGVDPLILSQMLESEQRLNKPLNAACSNKMYGLMMKTWAKEPLDRPTFSDLVKTISDYTEKIAGYLDMNFNPFCTKPQLQEPTDGQV